MRNLAALWLYLELFAWMARRRRAAQQLEEVPA